MSKKIYIILIVFALSLNVCAQAINLESMTINTGSTYDPYVTSDNVLMYDVLINDKISYGNQIESSKLFYEISGKIKLVKNFKGLVNFGLYNLSGSNEFEYYSSNLISINIGVEKNILVDTSFAVSTFASGSYNRYISELYFISDNSLQNLISCTSPGINFGMKVSMPLSSILNVELNFGYYVVFKDGIDGWDYGNRFDRYFVGGVGMCFQNTPGQKK